MKEDFEIIFPAIRGVQAGREYYVSMCPLRLLPRLFIFNDEDILPEMRAQRQLNRSRIPEMAKYVVENPADYVFSAITVSIDGEIDFEKVSTESEVSRIGMLHVPMASRFVINDGQHRRAAIEFALRERPELGDETIAVVFFLDIGLERCQQMFADLNRYAIRPSKSLGVLYDHRDDTAQLAKRLVLQSEVFRDVVEMEKTNLAKRSRRLFTLSAIYNATEELLNGVDTKDSKAAGRLAVAFWQATATHMKEWELVRNNQITAGEVRQDYINSHSVVLQALARVGNSLLHDHPDTWKERLSKLSTIDWRRSNAHLWEGRALLGGRVSKAQQNIALTANAIKAKLGVDLSPEEQRIEDAFNRGEHAKS